MCTRRVVVAYLNYRWRRNGKMKYVPVLSHALAELFIKTVREADRQVAVNPDSFKTPVNLALALNVLLGDYSHPSCHNKTELRLDLEELIQKYGLEYEFAEWLTEVHWRRHNREGHLSKVREHIRNPIQQASQELSE